MHRNELEVDYLHTRLCYWRLIILSKEKKKDEWWNLHNLFCSESSNLPGHSQGSLKWFRPWPLGGNPSRGPKKNTPQTGQDSCLQGHTACCGLWGQPVVGLGKLAIRPFNGIVGWCKTYSQLFRGRSKGKENNHNGFRKNKHLSYPFT